MQTIIDNSGNAPIIVQTQQITNDPDFLTARLHARRSRMAEAERLHDLCHIKHLPEFFHTIYPGSQFMGVLDFQRHAVHELIGELCRLHAFMPDIGVDLVNWILVRFQVENLKLLIRSCLTKIPMESIDKHLVPLPRGLALDTRGLAAAESPEDFIRLVPKGFLQDSLAKALVIYHDYPRAFFFEAALDRGYFQGLLAKTETLPWKDREIVKPIFCQETDIFHLMLVARGKFHYNLTSELLRPLHINGTRIRHTVFAAMLNDPDLYTATGRIAKRVLDMESFNHGSDSESMIVDVSDLEGLAWNRFFRLANKAFRQSHMGLGAIMGYVCLRRMETANLITISEGISNGMAAEKIRRHLIPQINPEGAYV